MEMVIERVSRTGGNRCSEMETPERAREETIW